MTSILEETRTKMTNILEEIKLQRQQRRAEATTTHHLAPEVGQESRTVRDRLCAVCDEESRANNPDPGMAAELEQLRLRRASLDNSQATFEAESERIREQQNETAKEQSAKQGQLESREAEWLKRKSEEQDQEQRKKPNPPAGRSSKVSHSVSVSVSVSVSASGTRQENTVENDRGRTKTATSTANAHSNVSSAETE